MDLHEAANYGLIPTYDELKSGMLKLIEQGKISREDAAFVLPELRESENERIRKEIQEFLRDNCGAGQEAYKKCEEWCHWLEKQKEQKTAEWRDTDMKEARNNLISVCRDWEFGKKTTLLPIVAVRARYFLEHLTEPKPAEWSEEDEGMINCIIATLCEESHGGRETNERMVSWLEKLRKSLRPQPKQDWSKDDKLSTELDDWSSFRREAAKDILCALAGNKDYLKVIGRIEPETMLAIRFADELTKQLKEETL